MSDLKKINEEFEKAIFAQIEQHLEMRDGQVVVVRKFPTPGAMSESFWKRNEMIHPLLRKEIASHRHTR